MMRPWLAFVVLAASICVSAQEPAPAQPPQGPTFRAGVDVITVDVSAVDRAGRPVTGLQAPDFVVRINGQPRRIVSVEQVRFDADAARRQQAAEPFESFFTTNQTAPTSRLIVFAVDQLNIQPGSVRVLLQSASRFLDTLSPLDRVAFFAYPDPGIAIDFTTDRARIRKAMELTVGAAQRYETKFNIGLFEAIQVILRSDEVLQARVIARECRRTAGQALDDCTRQLLSEMALIVNRVREDRVRSLGGLERLLEGMALVDAPKALILMSEGLVVNDENDVDGIVRAASRARASINVLMIDVPRGSDVGLGAVMPPTMTEDRDLQTNGLRDLAAASRGTLFTVVGNGMPIFERLASELSAYYLIGVEEEPGDRNDRAHRIDVEVRRQNVILRSRRAFVLAPARPRSTEERLVELLRAPFGVAEVPLRLTTFAVQDEASTNVRLLMAADVDQAGTTAGDYVVGWALIDRDGKIAASEAGRRTLTRSSGTGALEFRAQSIVPPGIYSLRLAVVDASGRRGAVVREVNAWNMAGEEFAVADLVVGAVPTSGQTVVASVEPQLEGAVAAVVELYAAQAAAFGDASVTFEVASSEESPALLTSRADELDGARPTSRTAQAVIPVHNLPAGRYVLRARVTRSSASAGLLMRPFVITPAGVRPALAVVVPTVPIAPFDRATTLASDLMAELLGTTELRTPGLKPAITEALAGRYAAAALEALSSGNQEAAAFLKGLDLYVRGQFDQAATQLNLAAGARREFFPAAFYLGATLAATGRDRDAASVWQLAIGSEPRPSIVYRLFADARFRDGQPQSVVDVLLPAWQRTPGDDQIARRLATAFVMTGKFFDALPVFEGYLTRNPNDQDSLMAAIVAQYEATTRAGLALSAAERTRLRAWANAYRGSDAALVGRYLDALK
jgi:VWFA-related protein